MNTENWKFTFLNWNELFNILKCVYISSDIISDQFSTFFCFQYHLMKPKGVAIAVVSQYVIMPLTAFCLAKVGIMLNKIRNNTSYKVSSPQNLWRDS